MWKTVFKKFEVIWFPLVPDYLQKIFKFYLLGLSLLKGERLAYSRIRIFSYLLFFQNFYRIVALGSVSLIVHYFPIISTSKIVFFSNTDFTHWKLCSYGKFTVNKLEFWIKTEISLWCSILTFKYVAGPTTQVTSYRMKYLAVHLKSTFVQTVCFHLSKFGNFQISNIPGYF